MEEPIIQNSFRLLENRVSSLSFRLNQNELKREEKIGKSGQITIDVNHSAGFNNNSKFFKITFKVSVKSEAALNLALEHDSFFEAKEIITEEFKQSSFTTQNAPAIAFPYVRSFISLLTLNAGLPPLMLPTYNFTGKVEKKAKSDL